MNAIWRILLPLALLATLRADAQSGMRVSYAGQFVYADVDVKGATLGLGYDHDLNPHLAYGIDFGYTPLSIGSSPSFDGGPDVTQLSLEYRAYYLAGDNEATCFFLGSRLGVRRILGSRYEGRSLNTTACGIALRTGIRGGLAGLFGELFVEAGAQLGGSWRDRHDGRSTSLSGPEIRFGFAYGFGWD